MKTKFHENGIVEITDSDFLIKDAGDLDDIFGIFFANNCSTIIIKKENISNDFFELSSGFAGEMLQKFSNYRKRMAIIGNYSAIKSKALKDFIFESNKTKQILFVGSTEEAIKIFEDKKNKIEQ
ncbi:MAG: DUF4180 domain-containing protein [Treponema sp.]|jgi:hypothetical protein|nr:DUF4180 domain-containing protein [Treponema sp.]